MSTETLAQALAARIYEGVSPGMGGPSEPLWDAYLPEGVGLILAATVLAHFGVGSEEELTRAVAAGKRAIAIDEKASPSENYEWSNGYRHCLDNILRPASRRAAGVAVGEPTDG